MRAGRVLGPIAAAMLAAELGVRLLAPRERLARSAPVELERHFTAEEIERGARFARGQLALAACGAAVDGLTLWAFVRRAGRWLPGHRLPPVAGGAADAAALAVVGSVMPLPLAALARRRAMAVGLVTQSWPGWAVDRLKASVIQTGFAGAGGALVVASTRRYPRGWWLLAAAGSVLFGSLLATLAPVLLDPVFNDFTPLPEGEQHRDVLELAAAAGVKVGEAYAVDASRRTTAANAYVTGLGPTKRVVLFDTLLDRFERDEIRVVVAHELGHVRHRDVARSIAFAAITAPAMALAAQRLSWVLSPERGTPAAIPTLALSAALVSLPVGVIANRLSRAVERHADAFSLTLSGAPDAFISFERKIALQNVADLDPPRWVTSLLATHPPTAERMRAALDYRNKRALQRPPSNPPPPRRRTRGGS